MITKSFDVKSYDEVIIITFINGENQ